jgi:Fe-S-cluster-containing dehydrogenase component/CRP-like cAMP-binding protein
VSEDQAAGRPQRWDKPFGLQSMTDADVDRVLALPSFASVEPDEFPKDLPLREIIANDGRIQRFSRGDIIVQRGDYGSSVFVILKGSVRGLASEEAERAIAPADTVARKSWFGALAQLWQNSKIPEFRSAVKYELGAAGGKKSFRQSVNRAIVVSPSYMGLNRRGRMTGGASPGSKEYWGGNLRSNPDEPDETFVTRLEDIDDIIADYNTFPIAAPEMFGELAAMARSPRGATIFAEADEVEVVELRWQALREIRRWSEGFSKRIDALYRERGLITHLRSSPIFKHLDDATLEIIAGQTLFETHGDFEWSMSFQRARDREGHVDSIIEQEPVIAEEGHYLDGLILIRSGFARVSIAVDHGQKTVGFLANDDAFGLEEIVASQRGESDHKLRRSLRAIGYVDLLRVPTNLVEQYLLDDLPSGLLDDSVLVQQSEILDQALPTGDETEAAEQPLLDFLIDNRVINGTATMLINTDKCVNCDDCVRACAATHDGNPRFVRHGIAYRNFMVANACMHCVDPVCLIGCPTGAIHRSTTVGNVVIDDTTCVGCATCATSCPYNNIRMVETRDSSGALIADDQFMPIAKATKCDLCAGQQGGPACERACPHDALTRMDIRDSKALGEWLHR